MGRKRIRDTSKKIDMTRVNESSITYRDIMRHSETGERMRGREDVRAPESREDRKRAGAEIGIG